MQNLVIVESPTKARTLTGYLGSEYQVEASMGHVRDLPKGDLGVDTERDFTPRYVVPREKIKRVNELKKLIKGVKALWLATDPDREGEAIAWHLAEILKVDDRLSSIHRVVFHEITPEAIKEAFEEPRQIDLRLVNAQQTRRVLDRLVGYKLSPLLWKKVKSGLSAGRVQSVAVRLIVEREKEIEAFKPTEYWIIEAELAKSSSTSPAHFLAVLVEQNSKKLVIKNKSEAEKHVQALEKADYQVARVTKKEVKKYPAPPFTTSTLQQTASLNLSLSAKKTMAVAQALYERGLITYMRTDSLQLSHQAVTAARKFIQENLGSRYLPPQARVYKTKSKVAQEAHEAIRPTRIELQTRELKDAAGLTRDHLHLYDLIWKRTLACQMSEAVFDQTLVDISADNYLLRSTGSQVKFDGWLKIYNKRQENGQEGEKKAQTLPDLTEGEPLNLIKLLPGQHFTEPSPRFNEASLIKKLEELGIGRPSTYAPTLTTIQERFYVEKKERKFFPTILGVTVTDFLLKYFPHIIDYDFTAEMEENLDEIARGEREWKETVGEFYQPFAEHLNEVGEEAEKVIVEAEVVDKKCPKCGKNLVVRFGRFGKFLACSGFPECKHTESFETMVDTKCPQCGGGIVIRKTKKGRPFYGCQNWPNCKFASWTKPKSGKQASA